MAKKGIPHEKHQCGYSLGEAALKYADAKLLAAYKWAVKRQLAYGAANFLKTVETWMSPTIPDSTKDQLGQAYGVDWRKLPAELDIQKMIARLRRCAKPPRRYPGFYTKQMSASLAVEISSGKHYVTGFATPRKPEDPPVEVPADVLKSNPKINFASSELSGNGLEFVDVRTRRRVDDEHTTLTPRARKKMIRDAAQLLASRFKISHNTPRKIIGSKIRNECEVPDDETGFSDDNVWRHAEPILLEYANRQKSRNNN